MMCKYIALHCTQIVDGILEFIIGHLGLGSNVQLGLVDFKVLWPITNFKIHKTKLDI